MAWQYANWEEQATPELQLERLKQWRTELRSALTLGVTGQGHSVNSGDIQRALQASDADLQRLQAQVDSRAGGRRPVLVTSRTRGRH